MDLFIKQQEITQKAIEIKIRNFKKTSKDRQTRGYLQSQINGLNTLWDEFYKRHNNIMAIRDDDQIPYFEDNVYETVENNYSEILGSMTEALYVLTEPKQPVAGSSSITIQEQNNIPGRFDIQLPRIVIPKFNGEYNEWRSFCDLYTSIIHSNAAIPKVQKMQYLKSNLEGEAESLIKGLQVTERNYDSAWEILQNRYENKRLLVDHELKKIFSLSKITIENSKSIKHLIDTTNECLQSLSNLDISIEEWDPLIVFMTVQKLPTETHQLWEQSQLTDDVASFKDLNTFLVRRFKTLDIINQSKPPATYTHRRTNSFVTNNSGKISSCSLCSKGFHPLKACPVFSGMNISERHAYIVKKNLCKKCFAYSHTTNNCASLFKCVKCQQGHNTLLHFENPLPNISSSMIRSGSSPTDIIAVDGQPQGLQSSAYISDHDNETPTQAQIETINMQPSAYLSAEVSQALNIVILPTALVTVFSSSGVPHTMRALIDQCSMSTFITEAAITTLGISKFPVNVSVTGIGNSAAPISTAVAKFTINSRFMPFHFDVKALVLPSLTQFLPSEPINIPALHNTNLQLADPTYGEPQKIDILLGAEAYSQILLEGIKRMCHNGPLLQNTALGWILSGNAKKKTNNIVALHSHTDENLNETLKMFWQLEEIQQQKVVSCEDLQCESFYNSTHRRLNDGSYEVQLPFKNNPIGSPVALFGNSRDAAVSRLVQMERRFARDPILRQNYISCIEEYLQMNHMIEDFAPTPHYTTSQITSHNCMYLPHHAVIKESSTTTKLRVVFDASCKSSNSISLNDKLLTGPPLQDELIIIISKWRKHAVALNADIEKMYRMVKVAENHTPYQKIVWRSNSNDPIKDYRLLTLTFGTASAPYLAIKTLQQLATDEEANYPLGAKAVREDFYVDDLLSGADCIQAAKNLQTEIIRLLKSGGFSIRKWSSNCPELLTHISPENREVELPLSTDVNSTIKKLGLHWNPNSDHFKFTFKDSSNSSSNPTKRLVLSEIAKLFDPLGWLSPCIITPKIIMQEIWLSGINWDDQLPRALLQKWDGFKNNLKHIENIKIARWVNTHSANENIEIHGFCDASEKAYAAVVYLKVFMPNSVCKTEIIIAKTRVAPIKQISLPRLELCGALLLSKLIYKLKPIFNSKNIFAWTDSTIVLAWLRSHPSKWKSFVANRVSEIHDVLQQNNWHHVRSHENPADCATRGILPQELSSHPLWWHGPDWLNQPKQLWPISTDEITTDAEIKQLSTKTAS